MKRKPQNLGGAPVGTPSGIPFDRSGEADLEEQQAYGAPPAEGSMPPGAPQGTPPEAVSGLLGDAGASMTGDTAGVDSSMLSDAELAQMTQDDSDLQAEQLLQQLNDPNIPPAEKAFIQQQLVLAAKRRLAGVGGGM